MDKVAVIILNYKLKMLTLNCLDSVLSSSYKNILPIIVDNNSEDGVKEALEKYSDVSFIQAGDNLGYAQGNNLGIKKALKENADFIFILNPDAEVTSNAINILVTSARKYGSAIFGPKIYFGGKESNSKIIWYAGGKFDELNVIGAHMGVDEKDLGQYDKQEDVDFVTGAAMFVSKEVFEKVGLFDERYFLYYEDSDFCFRAKKKGFRSVYIPEATVYHANAKSTGLGSSLQDYYITRNRMLFAEKFLSYRTRFALFREAIKNFKNLDRKKALIDFFLRKFGKSS